MRHETMDRLLKMTRTYNATHLEPLKIIGEVLPATRKMWLGEVFCPQPPSHARHSSLSLREINLTKNRLTGEEICKVTCRWYCQTSGPWSTPRTPRLTRYRGCEMVSNRFLIRSVCSSEDQTLAAHAVNCPFFLKRSQACRKMRYVRTTQRCPSLVVCALVPRCTHCIRLPVSSP